MEAFFEILIPLLVVIYFVYSFFKGLVSSDDESTAPPDPDDEEARRIQEEIRRKIVARQQGRSGEAGGEASPVTPPPMVAAPPPLTQVRESVSQGRPPEPAPVAQRSFREESSPSLSSSPAGRQSPVYTIERELEEQRNRLALAQEERERAERISRERLRRAQNRTRRKELEARPTTESLTSDEILDLLQTEEGLKKAFILREVLDRPLALRQLHDSFSDFSR